VTRRHAAIVLALIGCLCASGCNKRISDIDAPGSPSPVPSGPYWAVPPGVSVASALRGTTEIDGLYASSDPRERCCWIAPSATLVAPKSAGTATAILTVWIPDYPFFEANAQGLSVVIAGREERRTALAPGVHRLRFALPDSIRARAGDVRFALHTDRTFVPYAEHVNADRRALGLIVLGVAYQ
jgi:hypothetical protein